MDDLDHLPLVEHHQTLEVHYQTLLRLLPEQEQEFVLLVPVEAVLVPQVEPKSVQSYILVLEVAY
jgi:hypothetical protein